MTDVESTDYLTFERWYYAVSAISNFFFIIGICLGIIYMQYLLILFRTLNTLEDGFTDDAMASLINSEKRITLVVSFTFLLCVLFEIVNNLSLKFFPLLLVNYLLLIIWMALIIVYHLRVTKGIQE